jgi:hypothetical protein
VSALKPCALALSALGIIAGSILFAQEVTLEPAKRFGSSVTGAIEGWFDNADGTHTFLIGYMNRNRNQDVDIPIGPNNRIEPGGPDMGQPTHFLAGRGWGVFTITVPKEFSVDQKFIWTLAINGMVTSIPLHLLPDYNISPFVDASNNTPPVLRLEEHGRTIQGPVADLSKAISRTATVGTPLPLKVWITDDAVYTSGTGAPPRAGRAPVTMFWAKYRGAGTVTFEKANPEVKKLATSESGFSGEAETTAKFSDPGDYVLEVTINDYSGVGGGGFQCCWTTAMVKVSVSQ